MNTQTMWSEIFNYQWQGVQPPAMVLGDGATGPRVELLSAVTPTPIPITGSGYTPYVIQPGDLRQPVAGQMRINALFGAPTVVNWQQPIAWGLRRGAAGAWMKVGYLINPEWTFGVADVTSNDALIIPNHNLIVGDQVRVWAYPAFMGNLPTGLAAGVYTVATAVAGERVTLTGVTITANGIGQIGKLGSALPVIVGIQTMLDLTVNEEVF